jgi:hypothetical protein
VGGTIPARINRSRPLGVLQADDRRPLERGLLRAKRWTFIDSGVTHPRFQELFAEVTTAAQQERVGAALGGLLVPVLA